MREQRLFKRVLLCSTIFVVLFFVFFFFHTISLNQLTFGMLWCYGTDYKGGGFICSCFCSVLLLPVHFARFIQAMRQKQQSYCPREPAVIREIYAFINRLSLKISFFLYVLRVYVCMTLAGV